MFWQTSVTGREYFTGEDTEMLITSPVININSNSSSQIPATTTSSITRLGSLAWL